MSHIRFSLALAVLSFVAPAFGALQLFPDNGKKLEQPVAEAYDAFKQQDFAKAAKLFMAQAMKGDKNALFAMGRLYQEGKGVEVSAQLAEEYYKKAVALGHEPSRYNLGLLMLADEKRVAEGLKTLEASATSGYVRAQFDLGQLYLAGRGVTQDAALARDWFEKASKQADGEDAFFVLGQLHELGQGVTKSLNQALKFYEEGAQRNNMQAILRLADLYATGKEDVKADVAKAKKYLTDAANREENSATARYNLGVLLEKIDKDLPGAYGEYSRAAEKGDLQGMLRVAMMLQAGEGTAKDAKAAVDWYEKAAKAGAPAAMYAVGLAFEKGEGRDKDGPKGWQWVVNSAMLGNPIAMRDLAQRYRQGGAIPKDLLAATTWFQKAFQAGDVESGMVLCEMLEKGDEVTRDLTTATNLMTQLAQAGVADAVVKLADNTAEGKGTPQDLIRAYALLLAAGDYEPAKKRLADLGKSMTKEQLADAATEKERIMGQRKQAEAEKAKEPAAKPKTEKK